MKFLITIDDITTEYNDTSDCKCQLSKYIRDTIKYQDFKKIEVVKKEG